MTVVIAAPSELLHCRKGSKLLGFVNKGFTRNSTFLWVAAWCKSSPLTLLIPRECSSLPVLNQADGVIKSYKLEFCGHNSRALVIIYKIKSRCNMKDHRFEHQLTILFHCKKNLLMNSHHSVLHARVTLYRGSCTRALRSMSGRWQKWIFFIEAVYNLHKGGTSMPHEVVSMRKCLFGGSLLHRLNACAIWRHFGAFTNGFLSQIKNKKKAQTGIYYPPRGTKNARLPQ